MSNIATTSQSTADAATWSALKSSIYPGAADSSITLVLDYCAAAGLDPMQKPVHIVPMYDSKTKAMRDVVMPGIGLYRIQAARSGQFAGISEPEFGPMVTQSIGNAQIAFPEWCKVTVRRQLANGHVAEFTAVEYWIENYAIKGGYDKDQSPNAMWSKRPRGQLAKCAQAQALRMAFPEIGAQPTAEEMEGKSIIDGEVTVVKHSRHELPAPDQSHDRDEAHADATDAANAGYASLEAWWKNAGNAGKRALIADLLPSLKSIAKDADAELAASQGAA